MDDVSWLDRISLFRFAIASALCAGIACPLVGVFLALRRTSFYGLALPQFATAGVVFGFALLPWWVANVGLGAASVDDVLASPHAAMNYHLAWAALFTLGGLLALVWSGRTRTSEVGHVAAAFAIATSAVFVFGRYSIAGKGFADELIQGELLGVGLHELETIAVVLGISVLLLVWFQRDLLLISFDRETARVLGKNVRAFEVLLNVVTGLVVSAGTMTLGPTLLFGLLVLPPLGARRLARSMSAYYWIAATLGLFAVLGGIALSFLLDLPIGPAITGSAALLLVPCALLARRRA